MGKIKILIVEDEAEIAESIKMSLEERDYEVIDIVPTGEEAIETVRSKAVDVVLMDIVLGSEMAGTEAAYYIKKNFNKPIIFITAFFNQHLLNYAKISEPFGYLLKPFNERELYAAVEVALYKSSVELKKNRFTSLLNIEHKITHQINRLKDKENFLKNVCNIFVDSSAYKSSFIIILDDERNVTSSASSGQDENFLRLLDQLNKKEFPDWFRKTLVQTSASFKGNIIFHEHGKNFTAGQGSQTALVVKLESNHNVYGILTVFIEKKRVENEEIKLLESIACEIAFALNRIDLEKNNLKMETALAESAQRYKQVIENAADLIFISDRSGKINYVNNSGLLSSGYSLDEIKNMDCLELVLPEHRDMVASFYNHMITGRKIPSYVEYPVRSKSGVVKWYGQNTCLLYENKKVIGFHCIARDVTERKKIEAALLESEIRYRQLVEMSPDAIIVYKKGKIIFTNDAGVRLFNASSSDDLINRSVTELFYPLSIDVSKARVKNRTEENLEFSLQEQEIKRLDGSILSVEITAKNVLLNNEQAVQVVIRDISKRKRVEEELRIRQREVTTLLDSLPAYAFFKDTSCRYVTANQKFCDAVGFTKEQIVGKTDFDLFPKALADKYKIDDESVISTGKKKFVFEEHFLDQGKQITISTRKVPLKTDKKKIVGLIGIAFDIAERKAAEEAIKRYTKELEEINASKDKFFSIISHDLRSPFQGLLGLSNILVEEFDNLQIDEIKLFTSNIHNSTKNLFNLLENLLQWSRIQTGKIDVRQVKTDLYEEVLYNISLLAGNASKKNIKIKNEITESIFVYSDLNILNSTLQNLISNAIKFSNSGGEIKISANTAADFIELTVTDTGVGIAAGDINKLFRIDTQFTTQGTDKESGTGLGLTICKELLEKQDCKIWVESEFGKGSSFTFNIPLYRE